MKGSAEKNVEAEVSVEFEDDIGEIGESEQISDEIKENEPVEDHSHSSEGDGEVDDDVGFDQAVLNNDMLKKLKTPKKPSLDD